MVRRGRYLGVGVALYIPHFGLRHIMCAINSAMTLELFYP